MGKTTGADFVIFYGNGREEPGYGFAGSRNGSTGIT